MKSKFDLHKFFTGKSFNAFDYFGAHVRGANCIFRVYAPSAVKVAVIGDFNNWQDTDMTQLEESGVWEKNIHGAHIGDKYKYRVYFPDGNFCEHMDPYAFSNELTPGNASIISSLTFRFGDKNWLKSRSLNYNQPLNIYEIHLGSWKRKDDGSLYTYSELAPQLVDYLKENHYTHVEFMPLTEYPSDSSWGYQCLGYYAATSRYGTPKDLMSLINELHKANIGVILDFVPVHFALDSFGLARFDGTALYEYPDDDTGYSEWGSHNFNFYRGEVCSFLQSAINFWIEKYHIDGIRMDAISNALFWQGDKERGINDGALTFIRNMNEGLKKLHPNVMKIAEDSSDYLKVTAPVEYDGLGFDYKWDLGFMNDTFEFFMFDKYDRGGYIDKLKWSMFYFYNELYILPFSHDEVVHGKGSIINKLNGTYDEKFAQLRLLYLYMMTHPGKKLNFMGNEFAQFDEWDEKKGLDWVLFNFDMHRDFNRYFKSLNEFYLKTPALFAQDYNSKNYEWLETSRYEVIAYRRTDQDQKIVTILNFGGWDLQDVEVYDNTQDKYKVAFKTYDNMNLNLEIIPYDKSQTIKLNLSPFGGLILENEE